MTYIVGLVIVGLFFLALNYYTELNFSQKWWVTTIVLSILAVIVMFNEYTEQKDDNIRQTAMKFKQGKTVVCDGVQVDPKLFELSIGTYTFIGKENTPNYGQMISAANCE